MKKSVDWDKTMALGSGELRFGDERCLSVRFLNARCLERDTRR